MISCLATSGTNFPSMPLVSVLMPAYNAGQYLLPAIQSILDQTYSNWELVIIDDGSTDGSIDRAMSSCQDPRISWYRQANSGKPIAMNKAIESARGEFYVLQDADDLSHPNRLASLVTAMQQYPHVAAVFSGHDLLIHDRRVAPTFRAKNADRCREDIEQVRMPAHDPTAMYRMSLVKNVRYVPELRQGEGYDYILRIGEQYPLIVVGECLYSYRVHWSSLTRSDPTGRDRFVREVQRRACERRGIDFEKWLATQPRSRTGRSRIDNGVAAHFVKSVQDLRNRGQRLAALTTGLRCFRLQPFDFQYLKAAVYAVSPNWLRSRVKSFSA